MTRNPVMKLWNIVVTAFLALFTALGLVTTSASAAVPQTESARNSNSDSNSTALPTVPTTSPRAWSHARSLPPTMKQRIRAEAHGKSPRCRHRPLAGTARTDTSAGTTATPDDGCEARPPAAGPVSIPLQR
ncbi:DUF6344 domain-containing protein [Streptomyces cinereospinus]|uniref:DUF6344 domain-containing protein n=1 Tax=Streptomyces cinereospinus TaxID=285561 RepID=A0ABV5MT97_9ACTN